MKKSKFPPITTLNEIWSILYDKCIKLKQINPLIYLLKDILDELQINYIIPKNSLYDFCIKKIKQNSRIFYIEIDPLHPNKNILHISYVNVHRTFDLNLKSFLIFCYHHQIIKKSDPISFQFCEYVKFKYII